MRKTSEPEPQSLLGDAAEAYKPLGQWLDLTTPATWAFVPITAATAWYQQSFGMAVASTLLATSGCCLLALRNRVARGRVVGAAAGVAFTQLLMAIGLGVALPDTWVMMPWLSLMAVLVCAPYLRMRTLRILAALAWSVGIATAVQAFLRRDDSLPGWLIIMGLATSLLLVLMLLLNFNERLHRTLLLSWRADREQRFLAEAGEALAGSLDMHTVLSTAARLAVPFLGDGCVIDVLNSEGKLERATIGVLKSMGGVALEAAREFSPDMDLHPNSPVVRCILTRACVLMPSLEALREVSISAEHFQFYKKHDVKTLMSVPFCAHGRVLGAMTLTTRRDTPPLTAAAIPVAEEFARRVGLFIDNARLYRDARAAVRLRDDFLSIASHELRTPLTTLRLQTDGALRLLKTQDCASNTTRLTKRLTMAQQQAARLEALMNALLEVNSDKKHTSTPQRKRCDLRILVREVVERFSEEAARAGCELELMAPTEVWGAWDTLRLDQVFTNLVTNAIKYGAGKPIFIKLESDPYHARFSVSDQGIGIAAQDQQRIFGRFERAVSTRNYGGFGLGLWVAHTLVTAAGGEICVRSEPGEGATFDVSLPLNVSALNEAAACPAVDPAAWAEAVQEAQPGS